jgi:obg-like ATPase 1
MKVLKRKEIQPTFIEITDIAGLVKGASKGEGLGNNFLSHVQQCDGFFHVLRVFEDDEVSHVDTVLDPLRDKDTIDNELRQKDIQFVTTAMDLLEKGQKGGGDKTKFTTEKALLQRVLDDLAKGIDVRKQTFSAPEQIIINVSFVLCNVRFTNALFSVRHCVCFLPSQWCIWST